MLQKAKSKTATVNGWTKVLVIDDESIIIKRLKTLLEGLGYSVRAYTASDEAIEVLKSEQFDLVITDLKMRGNDGLKVLETARQQNRSIPVIIMTGLGNWECITDAMKKGAAACISKPFKIEALQEAIDRALCEQQAAPRSAAG